VEQQRLLDFPERLDLDDIDLNVPLRRGDVAIAHEPADLPISGHVDGPAVDAEGRDDFIAIARAAQPQHAPRSRGDRCRNGHRRHAGKGGPGQGKQKFGTSHRQADYSTE
jgi:hypothetical protein